MNDITSTEMICLRQPSTTVRVEAATDNTWHSSREINSSQAQLMVHHLFHPRSTLMGTPLTAEAYVANYLLALFFVHLGSLISIRASHNI